ncbi:coiled-coil domain-containing protein 80 [Salmo salar]|uniref:Coiled-coil domain-containing protein 80 n=1 Tax=Salmo salar TaxID=8030 RepID=A0A1S3NXE0_SALSA|nr:coiled-coil domain-containing protein 80 [Salmo salar]XP_014019935.1 coiled-coil domain-containing protein 80 [Salmo salar]|eukprot:XP_014019934.1 PREDICTED: coiled-coil domain-containing protein 80 [Salmo salar]
MRGEFVLGLSLLCLLAWAGHADKQAHLRQFPLRQRTKLNTGRLQLGAAGRERTVGVGGTRPGPGSPSVPSGISARRDEDMQADQVSVLQPRTGSGQGRRGGALARAAGRRVAGKMAPLQSGMFQDEGTPGARARQTRMPSSAGSPNLLASFAGKNRVLVISAPHDSDGYYRLMMTLLKPDVYCELAERHVQQIVIFHQEGEMGGKVRRITSEGKVMEEPLDKVLIPRLMTFLKLEKGKFGMVLLRKTLQVEERYPYPVRLEAMYEVIDQAPMRKLEKIRQKGFVQKCKEAGVEGQVGGGGGDSGMEVETGGQVDPTPERKPPARKPMRRPTTTTTIATRSTTTRLTTTSITTRPTTTTTKATTTTTKATTTPKPTTTTTKRPVTTRQTTTTRTQRPTKAQTTPHWLPAPRTTPEPYNRRDKGRDRARYPPKTTTSGDNRTDKEGKDHNGRQPAGVIPTQHKPTKGKPTKRKNGKVLNNEYEENYESSQPTASNPETQTEVNTEVSPTKRGKGKHDNTEKKKKKKGKPEKATKRDKAERRGAKVGKEGKNNGKKNGKKVLKNHEKEEYHKPTKKPPPPKGSLASFLDYFENRRRLVIITAPSEESTMYVQQRDEYLETVCEMAIRKVSIITIFGSVTNSTMKIDHYQLENDKPMTGLRQEDLVNQDLITKLRKEFYMTSNDFYMVLTDTDMRAKQSYEVPIAMKAVFDYIDTFSSRIREMEQQKRDGVVCKKEDKPRSLENFLSRFRWRRRLFVISAPNDEEWAYQQQLYALTSQACNLGLRHISILKLVGMEAVDQGGVLELYPINGSATVEREGLSAALVKDIRNYFQISPEYFSMLLVGKDGNVKSWYPSPMWSMANIYDLVDSMQLRRQEMAIQQSLGMRCPEDEYGGYGYHHNGYDGYQDAYHQGYGY